MSIVSKAEQDAILSEMGPGIERPEDRVKEHKGLLKEVALHLEDDCKRCDRCDYAKESACNTGFLLYRIQAVLKEEN